MTAKLKHGHRHHPAHGADPGSTHERLLKRHAQPGRPEGAMHMGDQMAPPPMTAPPMGGAPPSMPPGGGGSMGGGPSTGGDEDEGGLS